MFERRIATFIAKDQWKSLEAMINQVYGTPKTTTELDVTSGKEKLNSVEVIKVIEARAKNILEE